MLESSPGRGQDTDGNEKWATPTFLLITHMPHLHPYWHATHGELSEMKKEFALAFNEVLDDKQLPKEVVIEALEAAMVSAYRKTVNASTGQHVSAKIDMETGEVAVYAEKEVVDQVQDSRTEVDIETAHQVDPQAELGGIVIVESTPKDFGRVAAQTARQVIQQRIREAEREAQYEHFKKIEGEIINGIVQATNPRQITLGLDRKAEGIMPRNHQIRGERFRVHDRVRALLLEVKQTPRGPQLVLSRAHRNFLRRLLEDEVPEIYHGLVEIRSIAREPGYRSKVAVSALQPGIDPVGACVGIRGVRIQAIVRELNDEKIDVIEWNPDPASFIAKALSPARVNGVYLDESATGAKTATVVVPEDQLSLAIGRDGQNARLAAKLTSWRIDIKSLPEATSDALVKLAEDPQYAEQAQTLAENVPQVEAILTKKSEGRPVTPEEYQVLAKFVDAVERGAIDRRQAEAQARLAEIEEAKQHIPPVAFDIPLEELDISPRLSILVTGEGFSSIGDLMLQLHLDADRILGINGVGPKAMESIEAALAAYQFPEVEEEAPEEAPEEVLEEAVAQVETEVQEAAPDEQVEAQQVTAEAQAEEPAVVEQAEDEPAEELPADQAEPEAQEEEQAEQPSVEEIFARSQEVLERQAEERALQEMTQKEKTKKKKAFREIEYDPDLDLTIVRRKRKRDAEDWDEEGWDY